MEMRAHQDERHAGPSVLLDRFREPIAEARPVEIVAEHRCRAVGATPYVIDAGVDAAALLTSHASSVVVKPIRVCADFVPIRRRTRRNGGSPLYKALPLSSAESAALRASASARRASARWRPGARRRAGSPRTDTGGGTTRTRR